MAVTSDQYRGQMDSPRIGRRSARAVLLDGDDLILIKRTKQGQPPYWVTPGGGVESEDTSIDSALRRELYEELGAIVGEVKQILVLFDRFDNDIHYQHFFLARVKEMNADERTGSEFTTSERGGYDIVRMPFTVASISSVRLLPVELGVYLTANREELRYF